LGIIANYCDRMLVMQDGRIVGSGPTAAMFAAPEDPYSRAVLSLRRESGPPARPDNAPLLNVRGLSKAFPLPGGKRVQAVSDVSFTLGRGETLAVVGESGSGKTTLGRCLLRLVEPDNGEVVFEGASVIGASPAAMRAVRGRMRVVFQDPFDQLDPRWTVQTILSEAMPKPTAPALRDLLALVGLEPAVLRQRPRMLSVGAQQRVAIARAIAVRPSLIVLDEPTSALTPLARVEIIRLLHRLQAELGMSFLFISHDLDTVEHLSHRVAVMYLGQVVELGTREQIFRDPRHPYSQALLGAQLVPDPANRRVDRGEGGALSGEIPSPIDLPPGCYLAGRCPVAQPACATTPQALVTLPDGRALRCGPAAMAA
jgi:oligopeptide/dipeptide ABC transporter ATP-binding protein